MQCTIKGISSEPMHYERGKQCGSQDTWTNFCVADYCFCFCILLTGPSMVIINIMSTVFD